MDIRSIGLIGSLVVLAGCASPGGPAAPGPGAASPSAAAAGAAAFKASDFAWSTAAGKGRIDGELGYSQRGATFTCSGTAVVLTPETPWVRTRMTILYMSADSAALPAIQVRQRTPPERSQDYSNFVRRTTCDATNHFSFTGLPDGSWFVITVAKPTTAGAGQDMAVMRRVTIRNGAAVRVRL